ncbi:MAG: ATP-binding protein [Thiohalocapsa sp.]|nr:ATP-binding protein [Thiohalocapsa sp.]
MSKQSFAFSPATKAAAKLRAAIFGPSGAGKTFSALRIAAGLGGRIAVIDTERGSASKYADRFAFDVLNLGAPTIDNYRAAIEAAGRAGYAVLIIDSLSHGWQELLAEIDRLASAKYKGNTWSAWSEGTPKQRALVDAILSFPGHVLATMRSKTEWSIENRNGKSAPVRVGLAPEQGKGIEYEFDLLLELSQDHIAQVIKDRTGRFQDKTLDKPGEAFGAELAAWLSDGDQPPADPRGAQRPDRRAESPSSAPSGAPQSARQSEASDSDPAERITEAQHRRLEALLKKAGLDRERVKAAVARWKPDIYTGAAAVHLDELSLECAEWIERQIPGWKKAVERERTAELAAADLNTALQWARDTHGWDGNAAQLAQIAADLDKQGQAAKRYAEARDGRLDPYEVRAARAQLRRAEVLRRHANSLSSVEAA